MSDQLDIFYAAPGTLEPLIERFTARYGTFETDNYKLDERTYKLETGEGVRDRIAREKLRELINLSQFEEAKNQIKRAYQSKSNNLLNQWDMQPILDAPAEPLVRRLYDLLYGQGVGSFDQRFDAWVDVLAQKKPGCWPAATFFLMFHDPQHHLYVKPEPYKSLLSSLGSAIEWKTRPNAQTYKQFQALGTRLLERLQPLGARDMIDVQSFIWVVQDRDAVPDVDGEETTPVPPTDMIGRLQQAVETVERGTAPRAWIFQANKAHFDLPSALATLTTMTWEVRRYQTEIHTGDLVYLWESGPDRGILAVARVMTEPQMLREDTEARRFYRGDNGASDGELMRVRLQVEHVLPRRISHTRLVNDEVLQSVMILRFPQGTNFPLSDEQAVRVAQLVEFAMIEDEPDIDDDGIKSLAEWQASVKTNNPLARRIANEYPSWVTTTFGDRATIRLRVNSRLNIAAGGRNRLYLRFNLNSGMFVRILEMTAADIAFLRERISDLNNLWDQDGVYRFRVETESDYVLLKDLTRRIVGGDIAPTLWPDVIDGPTFVLIHGSNWDEQQYGVSYAFDNKAGGARNKLVDALYAFQNGGPTVYVILYRPGPKYAFTAWERVRSFTEFPGSNGTNTRWILYFEHHEFPNPVSAKSLTTQISFLNRGLPIAFRGISIRRVESTDFQTIIDAARGAAGEPQTMTMADAAYEILSEEGGPLRLRVIYERIEHRNLVETSGRTPMASLATALLRDPRFANLGDNLWMQTDSPEEVDTTVESGIWRIHFPRKLWQKAHDHGVIGIDWPADSTNRSVNYFKRIKVGDRVVAYVQNGNIGSVGVVTEPFYDIRERPQNTQDVFDNTYSQRIGVRWHDELPEPVDLKSRLQEPDNAALYSRLRYTHTVVPMPDDQYETLLDLLGIDQPPSYDEETRLPDVWTTLATYRDFVRSLSGEQWDADTLLAAVQEFELGFATVADAEDVVLALRQLRLIHAVEPNVYQRQPYVVDGDGLVPLMALGLLVPVEETEDQFILPAGEIVPRLLAATDPQPLDTFAPELGPDGPRLLAWYAEADLLVIDGDTWWSDGQIPTLPAGDPAANAYNLLRETLLAKHNGTLAAEIAHADGALPTSPDFTARLAELGRDLLIDPAIVRRVYRSLLAGRHVVLSGPPGTGKTELAKRLPSLLWREAAQTVTSLGLTLDSPPVVLATIERQGYAPIVVTATEDWGVRDVVGGIAPRLDSKMGTLGYEIQYGALTRALLRHYDGTDNGRHLPAQPHALRRQDYHIEKDRYRGAWLVIDEFTRAPVDAAFGSLLTTLSGGTDAMLRVPAADGGEVAIPLPADFRIIGTLNSFDRHFLNQISEAMKRRFDFIDVLPPAPGYEPFEHGIAAAQALQRLAANNVGQIEQEGEPPRHTFEGSAVTPAEVDGAQRYTLEPSEEARPAIDSFRNIFRAIRVFRQLGTAQMVAVYTNLFTGRLVDMTWDEALDTALADSLADQLQVMTRDEQRLLHLYVTEPNGFHDKLRTFIVSTGAAQALMHTLREAFLLREATPLGETTLVNLDSTVIDRLFPPTQRHALPRPGVFEKRLRDLIGDRGL